MIENIGESAI